MNPLVERYVYDVTTTAAGARPRTRLRRSCCPISRICCRNIRVKRMVIKVLESLGPPYKMADQYRSTKRYLISPAVFDAYLTVLKIGRVPCCSR